MKNFASIGQCPICGQGRLFIAREKSSGAYYIACEECESEWKSPEISRDTTQATWGTFGESEFLSLEEARDHPWGKYVK